MKNKILLNELLLWDLETQPHAVITGKTGSGKTQFLYYLILESAKLTDEIVILDGKNGDLSNLTAVNVGQTTKKIIYIFDELVLEMRRRLDDIRVKDLGNMTAVEVGYAPVFCYIDELAVIMINARKADRKNKVENKNNSKDSTKVKLKEDNANDIIDSLTELILMGRQASIHLILVTQHFDAKLLGDSQIRSSIAVKVLLGDQTPQEYNMMNLIQEQLPPFDSSQVGSGIIMLEGLGWSKARAYETPFITYKDCTPNEVLKKRIAQSRLEKNW